MWERLYSKNGLAAKKIAELLNKIEVGTKVPRVADYSERLNIGRGTVQQAIKLLEEMKAIQTEARGHLGTFLVWKDDDVLLEIAGIAPLIGSMPLPYSRKYEGLASGIVEAFESTGKRVNLIYMRGATNRIESLRKKRCDYAVVSKMTADITLSDYPNLKILRSFGENTYVSAHKVFLADEEEMEIRDGMKVGVDKESMDQTQLTQLEFMNNNIEFVDVNYMQLFDKLSNKEIDATIWNADDKRMTRNFKSISFQSVEAQKLAKDTSQAVIIIESERESEMNEKWEAVTEKKILQVQQSVEKGEVIPRY
ncbi:GntR family transcriptional regulator YhfZ [Oceanobacillus jeddahense]|uniref:GntR family transcriptional regulator n=1 Tax=Oceanobacillus jeddahense TaxID=1462527 RepID=A0ABY5JTP8_9BACI|nr:GntR family transcriptional regulator YhfZ [Oceanobacillus jeddahense]UUI02456.1 GntR family transcriptional regulator [Oceanobacillus jeddahense]